MASRMVRTVLLNHAMRACQRFKAPQQRFQVRINRGEQNRVIDAEIAVYDTISNGGHCRPRDVRIAQLKRFGQVPDCLAQDLVGPHHREACLFVGQIVIAK